MMIKTLGAVAVVTASLASPLFAQDSTVPPKPAPALRHYRSSYNQAQDPALVAPHATAGESYFDHDSYDPSRVGGRNPNFNPPS